MGRFALILPEVPYTFDSGHMIKMAATPIHNKDLKIFFSRNTWISALKLGAAPFSKNFPYATIGPILITFKGKRGPKSLIFESGEITKLVTKVVNGKTFENPLRKNYRAECLKISMSQFGV